MDDGLGAILQGTVIEALSRILPVGALSPVAGFFPGVAEFANAAFEAGSEADMG